MTPSDIQIHVAPSNGQPQRLVIATWGDDSHRDHFDTNKAAMRQRFIMEVANRTTIDPDQLFRLSNEIVAKADEADAQADADAAMSALAAEDGAKKRPSQATLLVELATAAGCSLWRTPAGDAYATIPVEGHAEHWPLRSKSFRRWLARRYYMECKGSPGGQAIADATGVLEGKALFDGAQFPVFVRAAEVEDRIYIDLCDPAWRAVEVTARGWRVIENPPICFRRSKAMLPLPEPAIGGAVEALREFVNVPSSDWPLFVAALLAAYRPRGPYPVVNLHGEQGSAKTTTARVFRALIDPNTAPVRAEPREPRDLMIAANNGWVVALDNLSHIPAWLSDGLCRLSTGGGFSTRTLYENDEETIFDAMRPVIVNGIEEAATRSDLLDRSIILTLPTIPEGRRRPETEFWRDFSSAAPAIFGAMISAVSTAMRKLPTTTITRLPRMADFALWGVAGEIGLGLEPGAFLASYADNRAGANELALEACAVAKYIIQIMQSVITWTGTASDLLVDVDRLADDKTRRQKGWPQSPRAVSGIVKRLAPNLRAAGIDVRFDREATPQRRRLIVLVRRERDSIVHTVQTVQDTANQGSAMDVVDGNLGGVDANLDATEGGNPLDRTQTDGLDAKKHLCSNHDPDHQLTPAEEASW